MENKISLWYTLNWLKTKWMIDEMGFELETLFGIPNITGTKLLNFLLLLGKLYVNKSKTSKPGNQLV